VNHSTGEENTPISNRLVKNISVPRRALSHAWRCFQPQMNRRSQAETDGRAIS